jgi:hypothetical protein
VSHVDASKAPAVRQGELERTCGVVRTARASVPPPRPEESPSIAPSPTRTKTPRRPRDAPVVQRDRHLIIGSANAQPPPEAHRARKPLTKIVNRAARDISLSFYRSMTWVNTPFGTWLANLVGGPRLRRCPRDIGFLGLESFSRSPYGTEPRPRFIFPCRGFGRGLQPGEPSPRRPQSTRRHPVQRHGVGAEIIP